MNTTPDAPAGIAFLFVIHVKLGVCYCFLGFFSSFQIIVLLQNRSQPTDNILFSIRYFVFN